MAIDVMIKRRVKPGRQAKELVPLILHLRALATYQPGYISGTTLCNDGETASKELRLNKKSKC
jgi:antibiotic biosynthesis monooxygenase (ABM) superfamily enzyme